MKKKMLMFAAAAIMISGVFAGFTGAAYAKKDKDDDDEETTSAQQTEIYGDVCADDNGIDDVLKKQAGCAETRELSDVAVNLIEAVIGVVGILAVVVMVYGGVKYVTSTGDAGRVKQARDTIIYGAVGLVVALLAWTIVQFVTGAVADSRKKASDDETDEAEETSLLLQREDFVV